MAVILSDETSRAKLKEAASKGTVNEETLKEIYSEAYSNQEKKKGIILTLRERAANLLNALGLTLVRTAEGKLTL